MVAQSFVVPPQGDAAKLMLFEAQKKSMGVAYVLWLFLGGFGAHRFYLGRTGSAVGMLILFLFSLLLAIAYVGLFGLLALWVWLIVDAFLIPGIVREHNTQLAHALSYQQQTYPSAPQPTYRSQPAPTAVAQSAPVATSQQTQAATSEKFCPSCNGRNAATGRFCNHCGTALVPIET